MKKADARTNRNESGPVRAQLLSVAKAYLRPWKRLAQVITNRPRLCIGRSPVSEYYGFDLGLPLHRYYIEDFLRGVARNFVRGHVLEFQSDDYASSIGGDNINRLDIIHKESSNPHATIVADLTLPNDIPSDQYDCIICTQVLHTVSAAETFLYETRRILKPGGVLLLAVPFLVMWGPDNNDLIRWTPLGLRRLLEKVFGPGTLGIYEYGNSLVAAADIRGFPSHYLTAAEKRYRDGRFSVQICAWAQKNTITEMTAR